MDVNVFRREVLSSSVPVAVYFWSEHDSRCKKMDEIFEEVRLRYEHILKFVKVNVEEATELADAFNIISLPDFSVFNDGEFCGSSVGNLTVDEIEQHLLSAVNR